MSARLISPFEVQRELEHRARDVYAVGFNAGEAAERIGRKKAVDKAIGIGFIFGVAVGGVMTLVLCGVLS